jgi:hypothetical protein
MGGGGDVVGALATAEFARIYDGAEPVLGGLSWERRPIDPCPGPRSQSEIDGARPIAPGVLLAGPQTRVRKRDIPFAERLMAEFLDQPTVLTAAERGWPRSGVARERSSSARSRRSRSSSTQRLPSRPPDRSPAPSPAPG